MKNKQTLQINKFENFASFYNYFPTTKLLNSMGVAEAKFPYDNEDLTENELNIPALNLERVDGVAYFKQFYAKSGNTQHRLLVYGSDKKVYINQLFNQDSELYWLYNLSFDTAPITLAFKKDDLDAIILASKTEMKIWKTGYSPYTISNVPIITSMCMNEGVLFCTISEPAFKIWYATDLDAENIGNINSTSGYISLEDDLGYARKIITFDQDVYVFRDYGISKINYVKKDVSVSQIYASNTKIYTNTVCSCGNSIMFMTADGIYTFNGVKVSKTSVNINNLLTNQNDTAVASSLKDKYFLALRLDFKDEKQILCEKQECVNNAIVVINTTDYSYQIIRGVDVKSLVPVKTELFEKMLLTFNTENNSKLGEIVEISECFNKPLPKYWISGNLTKNYTPKTFTKLTVKADKGVKFSLMFDNNVISFTTYKSGLNEFCFKIYAKEMQISISAETSSAVVEDVLMDYYENWLLNDQKI